MTMLILWLLYEALKFDLVSIFFYVKVEAEKLKSRHQLNSIYYE